MLGTALLLALTAACSSAATEPPVERQPEGTWVVELSTAPTLLALSPTQVFAASYGSGVGGSQVYRVDRASGRREAQRTLAGQPNGMAIAPDGTLWVATVQLPDQTQGTGVQVLDPETLQTRRQVETSEQVPLSVAFDGERPWIGTSEGLRRYDPGTQGLSDVLPTSTAAYRILLGHNGMHVVGPDSLQRVDPETGATLAAARLPASGSATATSDGEDVWVGYPDAQAQSVLQRYDAVGLQLQATAPSPGRAGAGAALTAEALWVVDAERERLLCADRRTGVERSSRPVPAATGLLTADEDQVVVAVRNGLAALPADCAPS